MIENGVLFVVCVARNNLHTHTLAGAKSAQKISESAEKQQLMVGKEEEKAAGSDQTGSGAAVSACVSDVEEALKDAGIYGDSLSRIR